LREDDETPADRVSDAALRAFSYLWMLALIVGLGLVWDKFAKFLDGIM
jgi:hypothetical protein